MSKLIYFWVKKSYKWSPVLNSKHLHYDTILNAWRFVFCQNLLKNEDYLWILKDFQRPLVLISPSISVASSFGLPCVFHQTWASRKLRIFSFLVCLRFQGTWQLKEDPIGLGWVDNVLPLPLNRQLSLCLWVERVRFASSAIDGIHRKFLKGLAEVHHLKTDTSANCQVQGFLIIALVLYFIVSGTWFLFNTKEKSF